MYLYVYLYGHITNIFGWKNNGYYNNTTLYMFSPCTMRAILCRYLYYMVGIHRGETPIFDTCYYFHICTYFDHEIIFILYGKIFQIAWLGLFLQK